MEEKYMTGLIINFKHKLAYFISAEMFQADFVEHYTYKSFETVKYNLKLRKLVITI